MVTKVEHWKLLLFFYVMTIHKFRKLFLWLTYSLAALIGFTLQSISLNLFSLSLSLSLPDLQWPFFIFKKVYFYVNTIHFEVFGTLCRIMNCRWMVLYSLKEVGSTIVDHCHTYLVTTSWHMTTPFNITT